MTFLGEHVGEWTDSRDRTWRVRTTWAEVNGAAECVGVEILSAVPQLDGSIRAVRQRQGVLPLDSEVLRSLPIGRIAREARAGFVEVHGDSAQVFTGRKSRVDLAEVARIYLTAMKDGNPTRAVAEQQNVSHSAAAKRVSRARAIGLLPPTRPGRAAGTASRPTRKGARRGQH